MAFLVVAIAAFAAPPVGIAAELPKWELGAGVFAMRLPDYRGSDEYRNYLLPLPYVVYRGERLQLDRRGATGILFESKRVELDISANATNPARSDRNQAREGMRDLDPTVELGPRLRLNILETPSRSTKLTLELPLRAVFALDFPRARYIGWNMNPVLNLDLRNVWGSGWNVGTQAGPVYGDRRYHAYYYEVDSPYARPDRPAYGARAGYSGTQLSIGVSKRFTSTWVGAFVRAYALHGAAFEDSPLVRSHSAILAGVGVAYIFAVSGDKVDAEE
ncbi:MAG: MipA/OmpV family protein [Burkholderiales bacterium]